MTQEPTQKQIEILYDVIHPYLCDSGIGDMFIPDVSWKGISEVVKKWDELKVSRYDSDGNPIDVNL